MLEVVEHRFLSKKINKLDFTCSFGKEEFAFDRTSSLKFTVVHHISSHHVMSCWFKTKKTSKCPGCEERPACRALLHHLQVTSLNFMQLENLENESFFGKQGSVMSVMSLVSELLYPHLVLPLARLIHCQHLWENWNPEVTKSRVLEADGNGYGVMAQTSLPKYPDWVKKMGSWTTIFGPQSVKTKWWPNNTPRSTCSSQPSTSASQLSSPWAPDLEESYKSTTAAWARKSGENGSVPLATSQEMFSLESKWTSSRSAAHQGMPSSFVNGRFTQSRTRH